MMAVGGGRQAGARPVRYQISVRRKRHYPRP